MVPRRHRVRTRAARGVSGGAFAQFIPPLHRGACIVEIEHTGIIVRHIESLPGPNLHWLIAPALPGAFAHSITSSARASSIGGMSRPSALARLQVDDELKLGWL